MGVAESKRLVQAKQIIGDILFHADLELCFNIAVELVISWVGNWISLAVVFRGIGYGDQKVFFIREQPEISKEF